VPSDLAFTNAVELIVRQAVSTPFAENDKGYFSKSALQKWLLKVRDYKLKP
jgi:hypothetical protein